MYIRERTYMQSKINAFSECDGKISAVDSGLSAFSSYL